MRSQVRRDRFEAGFMGALIGMVHRVLQQRDGRNHIVSADISLLIERRLPGENVTLSDLRERQPCARFDTSFQRFVGQGAYLPQVHRSQLFRRIAKFDHAIEPSRPAQNGRIQHFGTIRGRVWVDYLFPA